jgi:hypothetical protein
VKRWLILGAAAVLGFYGAVLWGVTAAPVRTIMAPTSTASGADFVAVYDTTGCANKAPLVTWDVPRGCTIQGQGKASVSFTCVGARGASIPLSATASAGRPPATCNGSASTSVVIAGGPSAIPCCPKPSGDGADPVLADPTKSVAPTIIYYQPGLASTGRLGLRVAVAMCQECPAP